VNFNDAQQKKLNEITQEIKRVVTPTFQQTPRTISQQNNTLLMCQTIFNSIKILKQNAQRQLEHADLLKDQLNQLQQSLIMQQQFSIPHHENRSRIRRAHPYLYNERSRSPSIRPSVSAATLQPMDVAAADFPKSSDV
jgi:hypothetical protein